MDINRNIPLCALVVLALGVAMAPAAMATPMNSVDIAPGYVSNSTGYALPTTNESFQNGVDTLNQSYNFAGSNGTMTYGVTAAGESNYGSLHASYDASISNAIQYPTYNGLSVSDVNGQTWAEFTDTLTLTGSPNLSYIKLRVQMDGSLAQSSGYPYEVGYAAIWDSCGGTCETSPTGGTLYTSTTTSATQTYDQTVLTDPYSVTNGTANILLGLQATVDWGLPYLVQGSNVSANINFFNTAQVVGLEGFDSSGNPVSISSAVGQSGTVYPTGGTTSVPEPSALAILATGLLGFVFLGRRKRKMPVA